MNRIIYLLTAILFVSTSLFSANEKTPSNIIRTYKKQHEKKIVQVSRIDSTCAQVLLNDGSIWECYKSLPFHANALRFFFRNWAEGDRVWIFESKDDHNCYHLTCLSGGTWISFTCYASRETILNFQTDVIAKRDSNSFTLTDGSVWHEPYLIKHRSEHWKVGDRIHVSPLWNDCFLINLDNTSSKIYRTDFCSAKLIAWQRDE